MPLTLEAIRRTKGRLLVSGAAVGIGVLSAAAAGSDAGVAAAGLASLLQSFTAIGGNLFSAELHSTLAKRLEHSTEVLHNHDLTRAVGDAICAVIIDASEDSRLARDRDSLVKLTKTAPGTWELLSALRDESLAAIAEEALPAFFSQRVDDSAGLTALDPPTWHQLLRWLADQDDVNAYVSDEALDHVSLRLHTTFPKALREVLKRDFASDGKAYAGLELMLLGEIVASGREAVNSIKKLSDDSQSRHTEILLRLGRFDEVTSKLSEIERVLQNTAASSQMAPARPPAAAVARPAEPRRARALELLKRLSPSRFDELLQHHFSGIVYYLPGPAATHIERLIALIRVLDETEEGLGSLERVLDNLEWFKDFLPEGAFPVGRRLLEREEARERLKVEKAASHGGEPDAHRVTPESFYNFRPEAEWLGVFRNWDSPRGFHADLVQTVVRAGSERQRSPAAAIIGPGGSGKSVALRRLAIDLAELGHKVWWVEQQHQFLRYGLPRLAGVDDTPQFLLVDDIQGLESEEVRDLQQVLRRNPSLVLVVAGRKLPEGMKGRLKLGAGLFEPDEIADRAAILDKIAEVIPAWAETARQLAAEPLQGARLIRMLIVLARQKPIPHNLEEMHLQFLEILADDIRRIREEGQPGLAAAVVDAAAFHEAGVVTSRETLIALADYHQKGASLPTLLQEVDGNPRWLPVKPLMSYEPTRDIFTFNHDEIAEGVIEAGQGGLLGAHVVGDGAWRRAILETVMSFRHDPTRARVLRNFLTTNPSLIGQEQALGYVRKLLDEKDRHSSYMELILNEAWELPVEERLDLFHAAAPLSPYVYPFWKKAAEWVQEHYKEPEQRVNTLGRLYQAGCRASSLLIPLLQILPRRRAKTFARLLLKDGNCRPEMMLYCIELLGHKEAKDAALRLLKDKSTQPPVLLRCIELLEELAVGEVRAEALRLLNEPHANPHVIARCLQLLGAEARGHAMELLKTSRQKGGIL